MCSDYLEYARIRSIELFFGNSRKIEKWSLNLIWIQIGEVL